MLVLHEGSLSGVTNMRRDEALIRACAGDGEPRLRLYGWSRPTLSLGYSQDPGRFAPVCARSGVDLVRRPTGGRAVLHQHEVTYAFAIGMRDLPGDVRSTYRVIAQALLAALKALGVPAAMAEAPVGPSGDANCFVEPSWYEIEWDGRKLLGSAQVRRQGVILQHGALPISLDYDLWGRIFAPADPGPYAADMRRRAVGLEEAAGHRVRRSAVRRALEAAFLARFS